MPSWFRHGFPDIAVESVDIVAQIGRPPPSGKPMEGAVQLLEVANLEVVYHDVVLVLRGISFSVPDGEIADSPQAALAAAQRLGGDEWMVKAQAHTGGRGKGGGVKLADNPDEAVKIADQILGMTLVTKQTGPEGRLVRRVLIEEALPIERELYLGIVLDRAEGFPVMMASKFGGMEIEEVAARHPEIRLLRSQEVDILADGTLDTEDEALAGAGEGSAAGGGEEYGGRHDDRGSSDGAT